MNPQGFAGNGVGSCGHRVWCAPDECYFSEGTLVHLQPLTRWEDESAEVAVESRLVGPVDESTVYVELSVWNLRLSWLHYEGYLPVEVARRLRDQLSAHLDAVGSASVGAGSCVQRGVL